MAIFLSSQIRNQSSLGNVYKKPEPFGFVMGGDVCVGVGGDMAGVRIGLRYVVLVLLKNNASSVDS